MKNLFSTIKNVSIGLCIGVGLIHLLPSIIPSFHTGTKINGNEIEITKRKGLFSMVTYYNTPSKNEIEIYNFNKFSDSYGLIGLRDNNKDNVVDEIYFSNNSLTETNLNIKRSEDDFFEEADKIYQEEIKRFNDSK